MPCVNLTADPSLKCPLYSFEARKATPLQASNPNPIWPSCPLSSGTYVLNTFVVSICAYIYIYIYLSINLIN